MPEPQHALVAAEQVGQIRGVAQSHDETPVVLLAVSAAFGRYRNPDGMGRAVGHWGADGGPSAVWRLNSEQDHAPEVFARIGEEEQQKTGDAATGDAAAGEARTTDHPDSTETGLTPGGGRVCTPGKDCSLATLLAGLRKLPFTEDFVLPINLPAGWKHRG